MMKRLLFGLGALLLLAVVSSDVTAQQRQRNGGAAQGRGSNGAGGRTQAEMRARIGNQGQARSQQGNQIRQSSDPLSANSNGSDLLRLREEEKLAHDVYVKLAETSGLPIFRNISRAESQHMQSVERLVRSSNARNSALNGSPGVFLFPEYQQLYNSLVASGSQSPLEALMVGARIEEMDIADLRRMLNETSDPRVRQVLQRLMQASQNHLRAFASQIAQQGASYNAEFLSQAEFDQIAGSSGPGRGQQSVGGGANRSGPGLQNRGNGQQRRFRGQNSDGQNAVGASGQSQQGARKGSGGRGRGR
jgi:hypothetical protein